MVYVLTSLWGVYYLISNLLSLVALTVVRFLFADQWIWNKKDRSAAAKTFNYDIHGILTVVSDAALPELEPFGTQVQIAQPSIRVHLEDRASLEKSLTASAARNVRDIIYDEGFGVLGFKAKIEIGEFVEVWTSSFS